MKCVIDSSALRWLEKINHIELLKDLYDILFIPFGVKQQIFNIPTLNKFIQNSVKIFEPQNREDYNQRISELLNKLNWKDPVDIEVLLTYHKTNSNEMLFANKEAGRRFGAYGVVRDIAHLYNLAESKNIFNRDKSIEYLNKLIRYDYRTKELRFLIDKLLF